MPNRRKRRGAVTVGRENSAGTEIGAVATRPGSPPLCRCQQRLCRSRLFFPHFARLYSRAHCAHRTRLEMPHIEQQLRTLCVSSLQLRLQQLHCLHLGLKFGAQPAVLAVISR